MHNQVNNHPARISMVNGPNLNLLGSREPHIYGSTTLADIEAAMQTRARELDADLNCFQSNCEGAIIDHLHQLRGNTQGIIINPGGLTHTSVALRDALTGISIPFVEVHLSNIHAREPFRRHSYLSDCARACICGAGPRGYQYALDLLLHDLGESRDLLENS